MEIIGGKIGPGKGDCPLLCVAGTVPLSQQNRGWNLVRIAVAVVLLVAAGLKTHQLATEPIVGTSILDSRWLLMATVEFELFFGLWLLANLMPRATWTAAVGCFAAFTCVSLYKALSGEASCGCFGRLPVNPWITSGLDLAILASLLKWRPRGLSPSHIPTFSRFAVIAVCWLAVGLPAGYAMGSYTDTTLSNAGQIIGNGKVVVLEPEKWIGKRFPLFSFIEDDPNYPPPTGHTLQEQLTEGEWKIVLFRHDCQDCLAVIPEYENMARCSATNPNAPRVAFIEVPPYGDADALQLSPDRPYVFVGRLKDQFEWFVRTPVEISLLSGKCISAVNHH